ncbi:hypothetical protein NDU88_005168 [Pleurodeles waltl]|uniref:Uncharacterized protein n=1 Tax=Pleurodeles waltl TaxID=8319 RepID=A0AAV7MAF8_PLEWA|nr:hypothetical protein NDU88_005168 [Pleurodeles waltl]
MVLCDTRAWLVEPTWRALCRGAPHLHSFLLISRPIHGLLLDIGGAGWPPRAMPLRRDGVACSRKKALIAVLRSGVIGAP